MAKGLRVRWCDACGEPIVVRDWGWPPFLSIQGKLVRRCPQCHVLLAKFRLWDRPLPHTQDMQVCQFCLTRYRDGQPVEGRGCLHCRAAPEKALVPYADLARIILRNLERMEVA